MNNEEWFQRIYNGLNVLMWMLIIIIGIQLATCAKSHAHSWYDPKCCDDRHCKPVSDDDVLEGDNDYVYLPLGLHFPKSMEKPSHDSRYHVCYSEGALNGKPEYSPYCIYTRQGY